MQRRFTTLLAVLLLVAFRLPPHALAQHATASPAFEAAAGDAKRLQLAPGLKLDVWAAEPQLSNSVAFAFDGKGRVYLAESDRWAISVFDITQHTNWLWQDMSFRSVMERGAFLTNQFATNLAFLTKDSEVVRRVEDRDGDGQADHSEILASGFTNAVDGTAAGVLATHEGIYFANIPSLWRLNGTGVISGAVISNQPAARQPSTDSPKTDPLNTRSLLATGFGVHIGVSGHDLHGLIKGPDGRIYLSFGDRGCVLTNREGVVINLPDTGGVLRCEPDGRDLEVFCYGLRNPQELAFDDFGNLWTVDNDTAGADPCRVLHLVEGGDYGWRTSYQHMDGFGPWVQEELWKGGQDGILPPAGTVSQGPSGLAFYPGTGFGEQLAGTFLHADFPGGVWAYTVKPQGASYVVDRKEKFLWNCWPTDVDFGPDGAAYVLDWVSGWGQTPRGRIYRITPNSELGTRHSSLVTETRRLLAEGMTQRGEKELLDLLGHADRRVRLEAQWELADRGMKSLPGLAATAHAAGSFFQRLHALWAVGQIARLSQDRGIEWELPLLRVLDVVVGADRRLAVEAALVLDEAGNAEELRHVDRLRDLQSDPDPGVRRRVGAVASTLPFGKGFRPLPRRVDQLASAATRLKQPWIARLLNQTFPRVFKADPQPIANVERILASATPDPFLDHVAREILIGAAGLENLHSQNLAQAATNKSPDVRRIALLAYRRLGEFGALGNRWPGFGHYPASAVALSPQVTNFLTDSDPRLIVAAGRAIHDVPIVEGFPALAAFVTKIDCPTNLMSRVINACYRLGTQQHAQMLAGFAAREDVPDWARVLALRALADWEKPSPLDRVNGLWRPLVTGERPPSPRPSPPGRGGNAPAVDDSTNPTPLAPTAGLAANAAQSSATAAVDATAVQPASPSPGGEGRGEGGPTSRSAIPANPLLERAAQAQAARNLGRAAEIPVLPADLGRSVSYDEAVALRRNPAPAQRAFLRVAGDLMNPFNLNEAGQPAGTREVLPLQIAVAEAAAKLRVKEAGTPLFEKFAHTNTAPELRRAILPALAELRSPLTGDAVKLALTDPDPKLRATALPYLDRLEGDSVELLVSLIGGPPSPRPSPPGRGGNAPANNNPTNQTPLAPTTTSPVAAQSLPTATVDASAAQHTSPSPGGEGWGEGGRPTNIPLAQAALAALAKLPGAKADEAIRGAFAQLEAKQLPVALTLDVREAARARGLAAQRAALPGLLVGGNAERGRQVFFQSQTVQCLRCHKVGTDGGIVGPELTGIGKRQSRDYLLESILQPNAKIAAGFEGLVLTLDDGSTVAGTLKAEGDAELAVEVTGEDGLPAITKVAKSAVKQRERGPSAMPEGLGDQLTPFELRDLVEYLATLQ